MQREAQAYSANYWPALVRPFAEDVCLPFLRAMQNSDGGWGYTPRAGSSTEPTCWAALALAGHGELHSAMHRGLDWLERTQLRNGAWPAHTGSSQGRWATALACLALRTQERAFDAVVSGAHWLCRAMPAEASLLRRAQACLGGSASTAFGWSAVNGGESAVEPTAAAALLFQNLPPDLLSRRARRRLDLATGMLRAELLRGSRESSPLYSAPQSPQIYATAWAVLALRDESHRPLINERLDWLQRSAAASRGPASVALAQLAIRACGRRSDSLNGRLARLHSSNQSMNQIPAMAAAALALGAVPAWLRRHAPAGAARPALLQLA